MHFSSKKLRMRKRNARETGKYKILEPVSSTSRRGARAAYRDEYPQDFGSRIADTVSRSFRYQSAPDLAGRERNVGPWTI